MKYKNLLGGLSPNQFLKRHWQKTPLLIPNSFPSGDWLLSLDDLLDLSQNTLCSTRLVVRNNFGYHVRYGPISKKILRDLPRKNWTLLVQGVNHVLVEANKLLDLFSFMPYARLDDVMVSYATPGGGVGPHFDSYDVFLLQGGGSRRWQVAEPGSLELLPHDDLKILKSFRPEGECIVKTGDMLYVPPNFSHNGVAVEPCFTYSIGFRAPSFDHIKSEFLHYLDTQLELSGLFQDRHRKATKLPGLIPTDLLTTIQGVISKITWTQKDTLKFTGEFLTQLNIDNSAAPNKPHSKTKFLSNLRNYSYQIHPAVKFLYRGNLGFIAGDTFEIPQSDQSIFKLLANERIIKGENVQANTFFSEKLYQWMLEGYIERLKIK
ncbi:MAG: cupin domain-containing protein [Proteobacteria bacterium]|nr:cupin domain-containing protein [Pseudomonadota bacterium]MDA1331380.1 cupin domain-containing protein [Pseudomonadota bacterium]